ncbi:hypothetical protein D9M68_922560 [compost metagenome]
MLHFFRHRAETVDQFCAKGVDILRFFKIGQTTIEPKTQLQIRHISFRDHDSCTNRNLWRPLAVFNLNCALERRDRLFQHLLI